VETLTVRLLPFAVAAGAENMATDEALLQSAAASIASLRFYGWSGPTVSLGYFQPARLRQEDPLLAALPYVRRPTGGALLVHHLEVTYALALPASAAGPAASVWLRRMHASIAEALRTLGVAAVAHAPQPGETFPGPLCFRHFAAGDLLIGPAKVVGSAQRRQRGGLLQHGAILLAQSPHTPTLPGIQELTGRTLDTAEVCAAVRHAFQARTGWRLEEGDWTSAEQALISELAHRKYGQESWNAKR
jgi:lipoate-protein ligase A